MELGQQHQPTRVVTSVFTHKGTYPRSQKHEQVLSPSIQKTKPQNPVPEVREFTNTDLREAKGEKGRFQERLFFEACF